MLRAVTVVEHISAPAAVVWARLSDVMTWSAWTPTITHVVALGKRALLVGSRFRIEQPNRRPATWTVTHIDPGRAFTWKTSMPGVKLWANHIVDALADDECRITLELRFDGLLAPLVALGARRTARGYLALEAMSLKNCVEADVRVRRRGMSQRDGCSADKSVGDPGPRVEEGRFP
jgi:hypothetical protein